MATVCRNDPLAVFRSQYGFSWSSCIYCAKLEDAYDNHDSSIFYLHSIFQVSLIFIVIIISSSSWEQLEIVPNLFLQAARVDFGL